MKAFEYGDKVTLVKELHGRFHIGENANIGMRGIVVGHGQGKWQRTVYWLPEDYKGEFTYGGSTWQTILVMDADIEHGWKP